MAISTVDALAALRTLNDAISRKPDEVPDGFLPAVQWAKLWSMPTSSTGHKLKAGVDAGLFEVRKFRIMSDGPTGKLAPVPHYKFLGSRNGKGKAK